MRCIYQSVQNRRKHWKVSLNRKVRARMFPCRPGKKKIKRLHKKRIRSKYKPISLRKYLQQLVRKQVMKAEYHRISEEDNSNSSYVAFTNTYPDLSGASLQSTLSLSTSLVSHFPASSLTVQDENEACSSQETVERSKKKRSWFDRSQDIEADISRFICKNYVGARNASHLVDAYTQFSRQNSSAERSLESRVAKMEEELVVLKQRPLINKSLRYEKVPRFQSGYFKIRITRGRERLKEIRERRNFTEVAVGERTEFLTLAEVLDENGFPTDTVVCCTLCRLLISKILREEFFMQPCDCRDKFVHSECALLNQYEMLRRKCGDCQKFNVDRVICRSRSPSLTRAEELALHQLNKEMVQPADRPLYRRRLPDDFEHKCHLCLDKKTRRDDRFENLDSTIIRACQCRVTAHNQCVVSYLLLDRKCRYCNYLIRYRLKGTTVGYCSYRILALFSFVIVVILISSGTGLYWVSSTAHFASRSADLIFKSALAILIPLVTLALILWVCRAWKKCSERRNEDAKVVIEPFQLPKAYKGREEKMEQWEEVPFERGTSYQVECCKFRA